MPKAAHSLLGVTALTVAILIMSTGKSFADECSRGQRASLPACAESTSATLVNNCSYAIYYKVDIKGWNDVSGWLEPGYQVLFGKWFPWTRVRGVYCCPNYSRCG